MDGTHSADKEIRGYTEWNKQDWSVVIDFSHPIRTFCFLLAPSTELLAAIQFQVVDKKRPCPSIYIYIYIFRLVRAGFLKDTNSH